MGISRREKPCEIWGLKSLRVKSRQCSALCLGHGKKLPVRSEENQVGVTSLEPNEERKARREQSAVSNDSVK